MCVRLRHWEIVWLSYTNVSFEKSRCFEEEEIVQDATITPHSCTVAGHYKLIAFGGCKGWRRSISVNVLSNFSVCVACSNLGVLYAGTAMLSSLKRRLVMPHSLNVRLEAHLYHIAFWQLAYNAACRMIWSSKLFLDIGEMEAKLFKNVRSSWEA